MSVIPQGSLVLVTGANGLIAAHVVDQLLAKGYNVRGTVRSESKGAWLKKLFDAKYGPGKLSIAIVADMESKDAFAEAVKGTSAVAHLATNVTFNEDPNKVIPNTLAGVTNALEAAASEPQVKRFVFTSSSTAALNPQPEKELDVDENTWNDESVERAWAPPPYEKQRAWDVYGASKTQAEQTVWKFVKERKPHFETNTILPNANFGKILSSEQPGSTAGWITTIYKSGLGDLKDVPPQWFINVQDDARLHVAALTSPDVKNERIFAFAEPYTWNIVLAHLRKLRPHHKLCDDIADNSRDLSRIVRRGRAEEILRNEFGLPGFTSLEDSLKDNIADLE